MIGPGKYDDVATAARSSTGGGVILIVVNGAKGHGFSVQADLATIEGMPAMLRAVAAQIEADMAGGRA